MRLRNRVVHAQPHADDGGDDAPVEADSVPPVVAEGAAPAAVPPPPAPSPAPAPAPQASVGAGLVTGFEKMHSPSIPRRLVNLASIALSIYVLLCVDCRGQPFTGAWFYANLLLLVALWCAPRVALAHPSTQVPIAAAVYMSVPIQVALVVTAPLVAVLGSAEVKIVVCVLALAKAWNLYMMFTLALLWVKTRTGATKPPAAA